MLTYLLRRLAYAIPILVGVNLITFLLFFYVSSPDQMAKSILGEKRVTPELIQKWKEARGYHLPRMFNPGEAGARKLTQTIFWQKCIPLFALRFGRSDLDNNDIAVEIRERIGPSLNITLPMFLISFAADIFIAMILAFYRGTYIDLAALFACVILMSISTLYYIIGGQFLFARALRLYPISGYESGWASVKFVLLPTLIGFLAGIGGSVRYNRTVFLEEINKDYIRTARAKGLGEGAVLFKHALKNAMIPILTSVIVTIPFLIMGNLLLENFFGIPGLGYYMIDAIQKQDFAVVRAMVYLGSLLYVVCLILVDVSYTLVDPRVRLS